MLYILLFATGILWGGKKMFNKKSSPIQNIVNDTSTFYLQTCFVHHARWSFLIVTMTFYGFCWRHMACGHIKHQRLCKCKQHFFSVYTVSFFFFRYFSIFFRILFYDLSFFYILWSSFTWISKKIQHIIIISQLLIRFSVQHF